MRNDGWVRIYRKILDSGVMQDEYLFQLWIYILLSVNHRQTKIIFNGKEIVLKPGSGIFGLNSIVTELKNLKNPKTPKFKKFKTIYYRRLKILEKLGKVKLQTTNKFTIITVVKWNQYQPSETQVKLKRNSSETQVKTNKNDKNDNNDNKRKYKKKKTPTPDIFPVTDQMKDYAKKQNFGGDLEYITENFLLYHRKKGSKFVDWYAAWQSWVRNEVKWNPPEMSPQPKEITAEDITW